MAKNAKGRKQNPEPNAATHEKRVSEPTSKSKETSKFLENLLNYANAPIIVWNSEFKITRFNHAFERLTGLKEKQVLGKKLDILFPDASRDESIKHIPNASSGKRWEAVEVPIQNVDGSIRIVLWNSATIVGADSKTPIATIAQGQDITERKKAEEALLESEEKFRLLNESSPVGVGMSSADDVVLYTNPAYERILGYNAGELIGTKATNLYLNPEDRLSWLRSVKDSGVVRNVEIRLKRKDGTPVWVLVNVSPILYRGNQAVMGTIQDITERNKMEADLIHLASFPSLNPNPIVELDSAGSITYLNPSAKTKFPDLATQGKVHPYLADLESLFKAVGRDEASQYKREIKIGNSWHEQSVSLVLPSKNLRIYGNDITERKQAEQIKDDFIGMVSHELRTPLTVIIGSLNTAMDKRISQEDKQLLLEEAATSAESLANILDNMLELSRYQAGRLKLEKKKVSILDVVEKAVRRVRDKYDRHNIIVRIPKEIPEIAVDVTRIEQVLYNLLENAVKYSPAGSEVGIFSRQQEDGLVVGVSNSGAEISSEDQQKLFQSFVRLEADRSQGIGLGLVVCRRLVEAHGGRIWVESQPGKGSTFLFTIPTVK